MFKISPLRKRQVLGMTAGLFLSTAGYIYLSVPANEDMLSLGPMNTGHEDLSCETCHLKAPGNVFQQFQANVMFTFGARKSKADFGVGDVDNEKCYACHDRPNDRHPTHRFEEPRFSDAMKEIKATECETCHREHNDVRVVLEEATFCVNCHEDLELKNDPLDIPHTKLIEDEMWSTCLQCHDFHGNHVMETAEQMKDTIPLKVVSAYLEGGESPYSDKKKYYPMEEEEWRKLKKDKL